MTIKAKRVVVAVISAILAVILSFACINLIVNANDEVPALKAEYSVGETVAIPDYKIDGQDRNIKRKPQSNLLWGFCLFK